LKRNKKRPSSFNKTGEGDMTKDEQQTLSRIVGAIEAKVDAFQANWQEQDRRAADGRKIIYEKVDSYARDVQALASSVAVLTASVGSVVRDVASIKPAVDDLVATKNRAEGVAWSAKIVWVGLGALVVFIGWVFNYFLSIVPHITHQ
jgi:hypothetical protein